MRTDDRNDGQWPRVPAPRDVALFLRLLAHRLPDPRTWTTDEVRRRISDAELEAYTWLHRERDILAAMLALVDDPSSKTIAGFLPWDPSMPAITSMPPDDLRPIDRSPAQQARARAAILKLRAGYEQQIEKFERGELTADWSDDAEAPTFRPAGGGR
jgi:hypothetical protein